MCGGLVLSLAWPPLHGSSCRVGGSSRPLQRAAPVVNAPTRLDPIERPTTLGPAAEVSSPRESSWRSNTEISHRRPLLESFQGSGENKLDTRWSVCSVHPTHVRSTKHKQHVAKNVTYPECSRLQSYSFSSLA